MTASPSPRPDVAAVRARFPAFESDLVFFENAGGSQVPAEVADAVRAYMRESYVQLGAGYPLSDRATETVDRAHELVRILLGGGPGDVAILGASCTQLVRMLAGAFAPTIRPGDEIVIMEAGHEANVGPWERLAQHGATIRTWRVDPDAGTSTLEALDEVLSDRTRVVAMSQTSNLLGDVIDVAAVAARTKAVGARLVVDGVAYAPHRAPEFAAAGADFYVYSVYKVYGPHLGGLVAKREALAELEGPNHFFVPRDAIPAKWEPGGVSHEACAGIVALGLYLNFLAGRPEESPLAPETIRAAYAHMEALERPLKDALVPWLRDRKEIRLLGPAGTGPERVPTVSFVHRTKSSREIAAALHRAGFAVRAGHMYSWRLMAPLGLDPADGVVRVSAVHYNTPEEAARLLAALAPHL